MSLIVKMSNESADVEHFSNGDSWSVDADGVLLVYGAGGEGGTVRLAQFASTAWLAVLRYEPPQNAPANTSQGGTIAFNAKRAS